MHTLLLWLLVAATAFQLATQCSPGLNALHPCPPLQALTPLQNSRLLLGCAPYLPDCTQLCRLLEWQQQRQQLSRGDSGHFLATAVAVGGPTE